MKARIDRWWTRHSGLLSILSAVAASAAWILWMGSAAPALAATAATLTLGALAAFDPALFSTSEVREVAGFHASRPAAALATLFAPLAVWLSLTA